MSCGRCLGTIGAGPAALRLWHSSARCPTPWRAECRDCGAIHQCSGITMYLGAVVTMPDRRAGSGALEAWGTVSWVDRGLVLSSEMGDELAVRDPRAPKDAGRPCALVRAKGGAQPRAELPRAKTTKEQLGL